MSEGIKPDSNTVLLDYFNGITKGTFFGELAYEDSLPNLGKAADLKKGTYIKYPFSPWYRWDGDHKWDRNEAASGKLTEGTIEMWVRPRHHPVGILDFNWSDVNDHPPSGHILHIGLTTGGTLSYGVWGGNMDKAPVGKSAVPLDTWTHIAVSWGADGTTLYVNGEVDSHSTENVWPAFWGAPCYAYLNYWGGGDLGLVDEFHISRAARTENEIMIHAHVSKMVPSPLANFPVHTIEGVGDVYSQKLGTEGINTLSDMASADVHALYEKIEIPLFKLYEMKRRAELGLGVKIDWALPEDMLKMQLGEIMTMHDDELSRSSDQPVEAVYNLKKEISTLFICLNNDAVEAMTLREIRSSRF